MIHAQGPSGTALGQLVRYGIVGMLVNGGAWLAFVAMVGMGLHHQVAAALMFALAVLVSYGLNRVWTFGFQGDLGRTFGSYLVVYFVAWILDVMVLWIGVDVMGWSHALVQGGAILGIAGLIFLGQRYWVFRQENVAT